MSSSDTCASCDSYDLSAAAKNGGNGACPWRFGVYRFDYPACVLHNRARDIAQRAEIVRVLRREDKQ